MTDLNMAYGDFSMSAADLSPPPAKSRSASGPPTPARQSTPLHDLPSAPPTMRGEQAPTPTSYAAASPYDATSFNRQYDQEQKIQVLMSELKRQKRMNTETQQESYLDRLMGKKKDLMKFVQSGLIVLFAFSLHWILKHYLKAYLEQGDISVERDLFLRLLYPASVLFLAWNVLTFIR